jgi:hypothetical protein
MLFIHLRVASQLNVPPVSLVGRYLHCEIGLYNDIRPAGESDRRKPLEASREAHGDKEILKE